MKLSSIGSRLFTCLGLCVFVIVAIIFVLIGKSTYEKNYDNFINLLQLAIERNAITIEEKLLVVHSSAQTLSSALATYESFPADERINLLSQIIKSLVETSDYTSVWAVWEPGVLEGRKLPMCYVRNDEDLVVDDTVLDIDELWYTQAINGLTSFDEPAEDTIDGRPTILTSAFAPIRNYKGAPQGLCGIDIELSDLEKSIDNSFVSMNTVCYLISDTGQLLAASDASTIGNISPVYSDGFTNGYFSKAQNSDNTVMGISKNFSF